MRGFFVKNSKKGQRNWLRASSYGR